MACPAEPISPTTEEIRTTRPFLARSIARLARFTTRNVPVRLVSRTEVKSSSDIRIRSWSLVTPALAISTSTGPCSASISLYARSTCSVSVMSHLTARKPWAVRASGSPERYVIATLSCGLGERAGDGEADAPVSSGDENRAAQRITLSIAVC